jgi:DNA repair exonuclease SbcCD ATPase subunit
MTGDRWLTYADAAAALGMTAESIRQRARREHWRKQLGNDGKALILVPMDADRVPAGDTADEPPAPRPVKRPDTDSINTALQARISEMESRANELRADLERERADRLQERDRAEKLVGEVADLARQLARVVDEAGGRERDLQARIATADSALVAAQEEHVSELKALQERMEAEAAQARDELAAWRARPWWRRIAR